MMDSINSDVMTLLSFSVYSCFLQKVHLSSVWNVLQLFGLHLSEVGQDTKITDQFRYPNMAFNRWS